MVVDLPGQLPHLAKTYAAVNSLVTLDSERALSSINKQGKTTQFFVSYERCKWSIQVASILNILDGELVRNV
ncbi:hypothetical protein OROMI_020433 [Orobanche minor]